MQTLSRYFLYIGFLIVVYALFLPQSANAEENLIITCGQDLLSQNVKEIYPSCETAGSALPGDAIVLKGNGFISGTKNSPVNIDQWAIFSGNNRTVKSRIYSYQPSFPSYSTQFGAFIANTIVPLELPQGVYTVSFKVKRYSCNRLTGPGPCASETALATVLVKPTADKNDIEIRCPSQTEVSPAEISCFLGDTFRILANQLRTHKGKTVFVYAKQGAVYHALGSLQAAKNHSIKLDGVFEDINPGMYSIALRENESALKNRGWEITSKQFQIARRPVSARNDGIKSIPQQPPVEHARVMIYSVTAPKTFFNAVNAPTIQKKFPDSLVSGQSFEFKVKWTGGRKFKDPHFISAAIGRYEGMDFKKIIDYGKLEVTSWHRFKTLDTDTLTYSFHKDLPTDLSEGYYILKITSDEYPNIEGSYMTQRAVYVEQVSPQTVKLIIPPLIAPNQQFEISGSGFPAFSRITQITFQGDEIASSPQNIFINEDGVFTARVLMPANADRLIQNIYDDQDRYVENFHWREGVTARFTVQATVKEEKGNTFTVSAKTTVPISCTMPVAPSISVSPDVIDQGEQFSFTIAAQGFTCRDSLSVSFEGLRANGKEIKRQQSDTFFSIMSSTAKSNKTGTADILVFKRLKDQQTIDADAERVKVIVADSQGRTAATNVTILPKYSLRLKSGIGLDTDRMTAVWKGFAVPGSRADLTLENPKLLGKKNPIILKSIYLTFDDKDADGDPFIEFAVPSSLASGRYILRLKQRDAFAVTSLDIIMTVPAGGANKTMPPAAVNPCKNLEGYMLEQCQTTYGIKTDLRTEQKDDTASIDKCAGCAVYCDPNMPAYSQKNCIDRSAPEAPSITPQYCNPAVPSYAQQGCIEQTAR